MTVEAMETRVCITGGGPAGMMLGLLLARAGVEVCVLEKHADFLRDFRGDTIHPSTLELMHELGMLDDFLERPHQKIETLGVVFGGQTYQVIDFRHLPTRCKFIAMMPQWEFLDFLAEKAAAYPTFTLHRRAEVNGLIEEGDRITGVNAATPQGELQVRADLVVGADGRTSTVRAAAGLPVKVLGAPMDVLWFSLPRHGNDPADTAGRIEPGHIFIMINRDSYWQCAYVIGKGGLDELKSKGLDAFRSDVEARAPFLAGRTSELTSWDQVRLLSVAVDRLETWARPGLLCIGDAAHAMSPIGGIGINLAIQDAVAAANILAEQLREGPVPLEQLARVRKRRLWATKMTQSAQVAIQNRMIAPLLASSGGGEDSQGSTSPTAGSLKAPLPLRLLNRYAWLRRLPGRLVGLGVRPEHVRSPLAGEVSGKPPRS